MSTEQTGRQTLDTTDSIELLVSPAGGDPTPLPQAFAADGTRKLKAAPPPVPSRTSSQTIPGRARSSTQTIPPPIPSRTSAQMPAVARTQTPSRMPPLPAHARAKGTVPPVRATTADPDGWVVPAELAPKATADSLAAQIDALAPNADAPVEAAKAPVEAAKSETPADGEDLRDILAEDPEGPDATHATPFADPAAVEAGPSKEWLAKIDSVLRPEAPVTYSNQPPLFTTKAAATMFAAEPPQNTQPLELVDLEAVEPPKATLPALPKPAPAFAQQPVVAPAPSLAIAPQAAVKPLHARRAPVATPAGYPVVQPELDGPTDQDAGEFDIDFDSNSDLTSALTTGFDLPQPRRFISQRSAIAIFAGAAVLTVAYLATRGTPAKKPAHAEVAETAPAEVASAPTPTVQPVAAPAAPTAQVAAPTTEQPAAPTTAATQAIAAPAAPTTEQPAAPAPVPGMIQIPVTSKPSGALVSFVDGGHAVVVGRTPITINVDPTHPHDIALTLLDHETQLATIPMGGVTTVAIDMGPEKAGALNAAPKRIAAAEPREETTAMVAPKAAKHEAPTHEIAAPKHESVAPKHETPAPKHEAPAPRHVAQAAPRAETPAAPGGAGMLMISSKPPCEIIIDGKSTHLMTPQRSIPLAPGTHAVLLVNAQMNIHKTVGVTIAAKKPTKVIQDFTKH